MAAGRTIILIVHCTLDTKDQKKKGTVQIKEKNGWVFPSVKFDLHSTRVVHIELCSVS